MQPQGSKSIRIIASLTAVAAVGAAVLLAVLDTRRGPAATGLGGAQAEKSSSSATTSGATGGSIIQYSFTSLDGRELTPAALKGKIVMIDIWATWCGPCRATMPHLERIVKTYPDDVVVIGVSNEPKATVEKFLSGKSFTYPMVATSAPMGMPFSAVRSIPTIFVIRRDGSLADTLVGSHSFDQLEAAMRSAGAPTGAQK